MSSKRDRFEALDGLRGVGAIVVAIGHAGLRLPGMSDRWAGYLAVDFFLVLSGFVLAHGYLYGERRVSAREFLTQRVARMVPLHLFTLITFVLAYVYATGGLPHYPDGTLFTFVQNLTITHNIGLNPSGTTYNFPSWFVSVEFWVNVIFILFITRSTKSSVLFSIALLGSLLIYGQTGHLATHAKNYFGFVNSGMVRGVVSFFLGILSYRMFLATRGDARVRRWGTGLELLSLATVLVLGVAREGKTSGSDLYCPFLFTVVVALFALEGGWLSGHVKRLRPLGKVSYSIYLNQITVLLVLCKVIAGRGISTAVVLPAYLLILIGYSRLTYRWVEKPMQREVRDLLARLIPRPADTD